MVHASAPGAPAVALRALTEDNWQEWRELRRAALAQAPDAFSSTLAEWSGAGDTEARWRARLTGVAYNVVADVGGRAVGMVSCTAPLSRRAELISLWVAPDVRGRGVGDALIGAVARWAAAQGCSRLVLNVRAANRHAAALYARAGFVDTGPDPDCPEGPGAERIMVRDLAG